jgi:hypothetical protein
MRIPGTWISGDWEFPLVQSWKQHPTQFDIKMLVFMTDLYLKLFHAPVLLVCIFLENCSVQMYQYDIIKQSTASDY